MKGLGPYIDNFLKQLASVVPDRSGEVGDVIAMFVANPEQSKFDLRRLQIFVQFGTPESRRAFADRLPQHVGQLSSDKRRKLWSDTILPYWRDRGTNVPVPFDTDEIAEMTRWVEAFPEDAKDVLGEPLP